MTEVKITKAGDSSFHLGEVVSLTQFLEMVKAILLNGDEIPIAILWITR